MVISIGRKDPHEDVVDLMLECHGRIRHFLGVARALGRGEESSRQDLEDACEGTVRYFTEALPLHAADEDVSVRPRLLGRSADLDAALEAMGAEHDEHRPFLEALVKALERVRAEPSVVAYRNDLFRASMQLTVELERHLGAEEAVVFPAMRLHLDAAEKQAVLAELRARRAPR